jgi:hypothetical protein
VAPKPWTYKEIDGHVEVYDANKYLLYAGPVQPTRIWKLVCDLVNGPGFGNDDALGETIVVRDFHGHVMDTIGVFRDGSFQTAAGILKTGDLGDYILRCAGHPASKRITN